MSPCDAAARRFVPFAIVGSGGFAMQMIAFVLLVRAGWPLLLATAAAVEAAVVHNFIWHEQWTWRDRPRPRNGWPRRFAAFVASTAVTSLAGNVVSVALFARLFPANPVVLAAAAVGATALVNFMIADRLVFPCP